MNLKYLETIIGFLLCLETTLIYTAPTSNLDLSSKDDETAIQLNRLKELRGHWNVKKSDPETNEDKKNLRDLEEELIAEAALEDLRQLEIDTTNALHQPTINNILVQNTQELETKPTTAITTTTTQIQEPLKNSKSDHNNPNPEEKDTIQKLTEQLSNNNPNNNKLYYHGAARLAFGQNPEISTTTTAVSLTTKQATTTIEPVPTTIRSINEPHPVEQDEKISSEADQKAPDKISDIYSEQATPEKRSANLGMIDNTNSKGRAFLLKHNAANLTPFDMAQYVFWTGDEEGVAKAVEELIEKSLMSRENAINFLRDISLGIEYLESSYSNKEIGRGKPTARNEASKEPVSITPVSIIPPTSSPLTTTINQNLQRNVLENKISLQTPLWPAKITAPINLSDLKTNEITNGKYKGEDKSTEYDDSIERLRLADFLYAEYSLEEVIYQLAKVMFIQSLTKGSEQAQGALQRLTGFLESEGTHGRMSPILQKKVLDVILAALSDCLEEHPELIPIARSGLSSLAIDKLPKHIGQKN